MSTPTAPSTPPAPSAAAPTRTARSLLFVPGDRPERFDKAATSGAHQIILDLEDAVAPAAKTTARQAVAQWLAQGPVAVVRINAADTPWFNDDLQLLQAVPNATVMLPKAVPAELARTLAALALHRQPVVALVETVAGVLALRELAQMPGLHRIAFGSIDFCADSGMTDVGDVLSAVRSQIVLESRQAGLQAPIDGVSVELDSAQVLQQQATRALHQGFGGKLCIHPRQVAPVNAAFVPSAADQQWAQRVLAAFEASAGAATVVDGKMVDLPVVARARRIQADAAAQ